MPDRRQCFIGEEHNRGARRSQALRPESRNEVLDSWEDVTENDVFLQIIAILDDSVIIDESFGETDDVVVLSFVESLLVVQPDELLRVEGVSVCELDVGVELRVDLVVCELCLALPRVHL